MSKTVRMVNQNTARIHQLEVRLRGYRARQKGCEQRGNSIGAAHFAELAADTQQALTEAARGWWSG